MANDLRIDIDALLRPIAEPALSEPALERHAVHFAFRQLLRDGEASRDDSAKRALVLGELDRLIDLGQEYIIRKSKDLVIASWMVEALASLSTTSPGCEMDCA